MMSASALASAFRPLIRAGLRASAMPRNCSSGAKIGTATYVSYLMAAVAEVRER